MPVTNLDKLDWIETMENFIYGKRPPAAIRHKVDLSYKIENLSIIIFEIRPLMSNPQKKIECVIAKTTYVIRKKCWRIYWFRADLKWHTYKPNSEVKTVRACLNFILLNDYIPLNP